MTERVLVTGGTGTLGREVVPRLLAAGHTVRVLSRKAAPRVPEGVQAVRGDLATGEGVEGAVDGTDVVLHCATNPARRTRLTDVEGTRSLAITARSQDAHLVYVSIVGVDRHPFPYYKAKLAAELALESVGVRWTVLRATQFHDLLDLGLRTADRLPLLPFLPVPEGFRFQPVDTAEVAGRLAGLVGQLPAGRLPDFGGPEVRRFEDLATAWLDARPGRRRRVRPVPLPGRAARAFREGLHLCPDHADGKVTWEEFLRRRYPAPA